MKPMAFLAYNLRNAPDLSLIKYQALEDNTVDGLINRHNDFQRQWNRITILAKVRMSLIIQYIKAAKSGSKMKFYLVLYTEENEILPSIEQLLKASPLSDYFVLEKIETDAQFHWQYFNKAVLKKSKESVLPMLQKMLMRQHSTLLLDGNLQIKGVYGICFALWIHWMKIWRTQLVWKELMRLN